MPNIDITSPDYLDNLEYRIFQLEEWRDKILSNSETKLEESIGLRLGLQALQKSNDKQELHLRAQDLKLEEMIKEMNNARMKQDEKLDKMGANNSKMIIGILVTLLTTLVNLVIKLWK